jgi:prepilin-type processing-associated H-X9-DG protein
MEPPSGQYPSVHFRHNGMASVLFLDGHVKGMRPTRNPMGPYTTPAVEQIRKDQNVADIGLWDSNPDVADKWWNGKGVASDE